ncbi:MAG: hypothetical protein QM750_29035 [Rubrivivax sp.]
MTTSAIRHLRHLQVLLEALSASGIEMERHEYDTLAFGNFALVLAKGRTKVRFLWNEKDLILTVQYRNAEHEEIDEPWTHDAFIKVASAEDVFAEIGSNAEAMLD